MLPAVLTHELIEGIESFLRSTFPASTPAFRDAFSEILSGSGRDKLFQGPYLRVEMPFQPGGSGRDFFQRLRTKFPPYVHQEQAWKRLRTEIGESTIVATGTGSGKTECFTYPILDHVLANPGQPGVKAIILYPMNALANDQAKRFAAEIHESDELRGKVRVGLYVGGLQDDGGSKSMGAESVITNREEMRKAPPDILLTNYKMLDYLLIRQEDSGLWAQNAPDTLRYLVVDELHTFDGAQGADLACLIRRVKARLKTPPGHLCCIGTSATLGGKDSADSMLGFARDIFGEPFDAGAVIGESRKSERDHIIRGDDENLEVRDFQLPGPEHGEALVPARYPDTAAFLAAQLPLWFAASFGEHGVPRPDLSTLEGRVALAGLLRRHNFLRTFLRYFKDGVPAEEKILADLRKRHPSWPESHCRLVLGSFVSLCAAARDEENPRAWFLQIRAELWMRELSRMVASVAPRPVLRFSMDLPANHPQRHLPAMHCRDCGAMGWGAVRKSNEDQLIPDLDRFYQSFFSRNPDPRLRFVFPVDSPENRGELLGQHLCGGCLTLFESQDGKCPKCGTLPAPENQPAGQPPPATATIRVDVSARTLQRAAGHKVADKSCPYCGSSTGLTIVGSRAASLTSVALSQIYGSPGNNDRKAMAFSDSVQDASHRAGFFSARTYQITLRTALRKVIGEADADPDLASLSRRFPAYWLEKLGSEDFTGTFIPPTLEWRNEFEDFKSSGALPKNSPLPEWIAQRMEWEVFREFGLQCRIGRTLEKSGAAACRIDPAPLDAAATAILAALHDFGGPLRTLATDDARRLAAALCERLRVNGGIHHPFLDSYLERGGDSYLFNKIAGGSLPKIGKYSMGKSPAFFATFAVKGSFERLVASGANPTWTQRWVEKWLRSRIGEAAATLDTAPLIEAVVEALTRAGLWRRHDISPANGKFAWSLDPARILVSRETADFACSACGHRATTAVSASPLWEGLPCLRHECPGAYRPDSNPMGAYFGDLYRRGEVVRVRAAEHTGLLERETREALEAQFKRERPRSTDVNLLSCTPTLEMGVDVGDLSTVVLCSVPPEQANYVQRTGRGGRRDGNSLALTVANAAEHDLAYYEDPLEMIAGEVRMPAIFLRAPAVLERQLTAYCIDRWIEQDPTARIPKHMESVYVGVAKKQSGDPPGADAFPDALGRFIDARLDELLGGFLDMFSGDDLAPESTAMLEAFIKGGQGEGSLVYKIASALSAAYKDREALYDKRKKLNKSISSNKKKKPRDEKLEDDLANMLAERKAISRLINDINKKQTLNFLTDEGLIPNYAFPEEGVVLRSVILKKPAPGKDDAKLVKLKLEHMRPAESAITELAPGNSFYVEGRRLTIDQIAVDSEEFEEWHFCKSCPWVEPVSKESENRTACPHCGCTGWTEASLRRKVLRMRQVFVTAWDAKVRTLDQKDEREMRTFNKQVSIVYVPDAVRKSYMLKTGGATFAFDFIDEITLRETNFGESRLDAEAAEIGGQTLHGVGFKVCRYCGKIQPRREGQDPKHDISCKFYGKDAQSKEFETTFLLYRQLQSEAIRLLIPSLNEDESIDTQSFVAAIHLGLKEKFGGHLSHLKLAVQHQPIPGTRLRARHVFIYDSVPGGTGYLKDLTKDQHSLLEVLELAYQKLSGCQCGKDPDLDGCYHCIKAYRFRFVHNEISRSTAMDQLKRILDQRHAIEERSADDSLINPLLESELERRFVEALRKTDGFVVNQEIVEGRPGYLLRIGNAAWKIIPQMELGPDQGVSLECRPDFVLKPLRSRQGPPIAVFMDGFAFHADDELGNNRIADDMAKRNAIRMSGAFLVWSLAWRDMKGDFPPEGAFLQQALRKTAPVLARQNLDIANLKPVKEYDWNNFHMFVALLSYLASCQSGQPLESWRTAASTLALSFQQKHPAGEDALRPAFEDLMLGKPPSIPQPASAPVFVCIGDQGNALRVFSAIPAEDLRNRSIAGTRCALWFDDSDNMPLDEFRAEWQELLRSINILQFVPRFVCFTRRMVEKGHIANLLDWLLETETAPPPTEPEAPAFSEKQLEQIELLDESLHPLLVPLLKNGAIPWPEIGYEALSSGGQCGASQLEAAWPEQKTGIALPGDDVSWFTQHDWTVLSTEDTTPEALIQSLNPNPQS